ncbi:MAG: hypothetical protein ACRC8U_10645, partial [Brooklawnia sp.]
MRRLASVERTPESDLVVFAMASWVHDEVVSVTDEHEHRLFNDPFWRRGAVLWGSVIGVDVPSLMQAVRDALTSQRVCVPVGGRLRPITPELVARMSDAQIREVRR